MTRRDASLGQRHLPIRHGDTQFGVALTRNRHVKVLRPFLAALHVTVPQSPNLRQIVRAVDVTERLKRKRCAIHLRMNALRGRRSQGRDLWQSVRSPDAEIDQVIVIRDRNSAVRQRSRPEETFVHSESGVLARLVPSAHQRTLRPRTYGDGINTATPKVLLRLKSSGS